MSSVGGIALVAIVILLYSGNIQGQKWLPYQKLVVYIFTEVVYVYVRLYHSSTISKFCGLYARLTVNIIYLAPFHNTVGGKHSIFSDYSL